MLDVSKIRIDDFHYLEETTSTNDYINNLHKKSNLNEFSSCFAEKQTKGRGRFNREWQTLNFSIAYSILLKLFLGQEPLVICTSIHKVLSNLTKNNNIKIKWPNDIMFNNSKISGILIESFQNKTSRHYVVGIGINITRPDIANFAENIAFLSDCLANNSKPTSREELLNNINKQIKEDIKTFREKGFAEFKEYFLQNCQRINKEISINTGNTVKKGIFEGISDDGHLILKEKDSIVYIPAGEILQNK